jgi:hypothetical protein
MKRKLLSVVALGAATLAGCASTVETTAAEACTALHVVDLQAVAASSMAASTTPVAHEEDAAAPPAMADDGLVSADGAEVTPVSAPVQAMPATVTGCMGNAKTPRYDAGSSAADDAGNT